MKFRYGQHTASCVAALSHAVLLLALQQSHEGHELRSWCVYLGDDALGGIWSARVGWDVEHDSLRLDGDDADGNAPKTRTPGHNAARPAGLALDPRTAVKEPARPRLAAGRHSCCRAAAGNGRPGIQLLACASMRSGRARQQGPQRRHKGCL